MKRCYILYVAKTKLSHCHQHTFYQDIWVRVEYFEGTLEDALASAVPMKGEIVLNSITWDEKETTTES